MNDWRKKAASAGLLALRLLMGLTMAHIGSQKVFGGGVHQLAQGLESMGFPMPIVFAWMAALAEFLGGLSIAVGLGTRFGAFFVFVTMCVAFFVAHAKDPFHAKMAAYLYGSIALSLILTGGGGFSMDALWCRKKCKEEQA